jgi:hypothetical protein
MATSTSSGSGRFSRSANRVTTPRSGSLSCAAIVPTLGWMAGRSTPIIRSIALADFPVARTSRDARPRAISQAIDVVSLSTVAGTRAGALQGRRPDDRRRGRGPRADDDHIGAGDQEPGRGRQAPSRWSPSDGVTILADSFTRPQNRICFQSACLESLTLQVIGITVGQQFGWSQRVGAKRRPMTGSA